MVSNSMDPMSMEASLYVTSLAGQVLFLQGRMSLCVPMVARRLMDGLIRWWEVPRCPLGVLYFELEVCKFSLIGRVVLSSDQKPWKLVDLKAKLQSVWKLNSAWRLISLARGIRVPLLLDRATREGDFGHFARVLVDIDMSTVPPSSLLLERDDSHSSFISVEYENLLAFCSTCSSIGHFPNACRWNKSSKGIPVSSSKPDSDIDGPTTIVADEGFQVPQNRAPKMVFHPISGPRTEVPVSNVVAAIQQDLWSLDLDVVHYSADSNPVLSMVSSTILVVSPGFTSLMVPTTSVSWSVNAIPIVSRLSAVVPVSNFLVVYDFPEDIGFDLSVDLLAGQTSSFLGSGTILESSTTSGLVFDVYSTVPNQTVPVIDSLVQTVPTIMGSFSFQRPPFPYAAHGVRNVCSGSSQVFSSIVGSTQSFRLLAMDSQAELHLIAGSLWAAQAEVERLGASNVS
ncbi:hypothetical protein Dsin_009097 [Dipteronia sinensis]|uniref:DUF4283 domain-containing protein n=1 Tax=Dipteronia sinensis TaxID=43782 RepID=A0AAE0AR60_9ROSI|nr:hypothetical protein Dsin_009097 [Dipteronia sinensis]